MIVQALLVGIPAVWAMRRAAGIVRSAPLVRIVLLVAAVLTVIGMIVQIPGLGFSLRAYKQLAILHGWPRELLQLVVYWPVGYLLVNTIGRRWNGRARASY